MKIIYCLPEISHPGGIGRITSIKANYLTEKGYDIYILTTDQNKLPSYYELNKRIKLIDLNINFNNNRSWIVKRFIQKIIKTYKYRKLLSNKIHEIKPDIIVSTFTNEASFLYKIKDGSKKILECHFNHDLYYCMSKAFKMPFYMKLYYSYITRRNENLINKYDAFVVLTQEDKILWKRSKHLYVIPNMLSFNPNRQSNLTNKTVIAVGRLDAQKNFDRLIHIWHKVCQKNNEWHLAIYGQGSDKKKLENLILKLNLQKNVSINEPTKEIVNKYLDSSILAMSSTYEGFGMVLTEAMACGLPTIAFSCKCGPKDIITNGIDGFCINDNNEDEYASKLLLIMEDVNLRKNMGIKAKQKSLNYSPNIIMNKWITLFQEITNNIH